MAVMVLLFSFMIQPIHQAMANEANQEAVPLPADVVSESSVTIGESPPISSTAEVEMSDTVETETNTDVLAVAGEAESEEPDLLAEAMSEESVSADSIATNIDTGDAGELTTATVLSDEATNSAIDGEMVTSSVVEETGDTNTVENDTHGDVVDEGEQSGEEEVIPEGTSPSSTDDYIDSAAIEDNVTDLMDSVVNEVVTLTRQMVTEENYYQFSKQSCVAVGDGTFHCTDKARTVIDPDTAVYAEKDEAGDMEIYLRTAKGAVKQLTDNDYDDTSPDLDMTSTRVVWQRLIDGRYQIISYDLDEGEEQQLTFSRTNSMEPKVAKEGIVWQAWDGNDWEILFFDGKFTDQITDNDIQDVTPVIEDGYVLWSVLGGESSEARVYSIESGEIMTITGHEGGAIANPRFVLVYDTKFDNGDVITQGFDPVTGLASPISAEPVELPFNIPEPDPVGEIRALINNKSTQKDKDIVTVSPTDGGNDLNLASTTAISSDTLNLSDSIDYGDSIVSTTPTLESTFELTEYDVVITNEASSTNSALNEVFYENASATLAQP